MKMIQVAEYQSDISDEEVVEVDHGINENKRTKTKDSKCAVKKDIFDNTGEAEASIENQRSKYYTNYTEDAF